MTERPILFSGEMVKAIIDGRKTQTRRVLRPEAFCIDPRPIRRDFETGMQLWVRETWRIVGRIGSVYLVEYAADKLIREIEVGFEGPSPKLDKQIHEEKMHPSIFMPRWASRITLEVTKVRVERVQDISEEDVEAEGVVRYRREFGQEGGFPEGWNDSRPGHGGAVWIPSAFKDAFRVLWDSINEKRGFGWAANPWCWVVEFQRIRAVSEGEQE